MIKAIEYGNMLLHQILGRNYKESISTLLLLLTIVIFYSIVFYWIKKRNWGIDKKRRTSSNLRNTLGFIFIIGLIFLWSGEIKTMVLSITALAAAIIIAFKEMILCFLGSFLIASNKLFTLGEYIEIDGIKGKVIDKNFVYTKVILYEPFQTREMNIPNIIFVTNKMINLSHYGKLQSYTLILALPNFNKIQIFSDEVEKLILETLEQHKDKYTDYFSEKKLNDIFFDIPKMYYHIEYDLSDNRNGLIKLHYLAHPLDQRKIENNVLKGYVIKLQEEYNKQQLINNTTKKDNDDDENKKL